MRNPALKFLTPAMAVMCLGLLPDASKATVLYFDPSGATAPTTGSTYTWTTTSDQWAASDADTASTVEWNTADAACFFADASYTGANTVDVNSTISLAGLYDGALAPDGTTLTLAGTGALSFNSGDDALDIAGSDGDATTINTTMSGAGDIYIEGSDSVYLNGNNTYTGGTLLDGSGGVNFGSSTAFGTGTVTEGHSTMVLASEGSSALNVANAFATTSADTLVYVGGTTAATTFSGKWSLPASGATTTVQVNAGTPMAISGIISGAGNFTKSGAGTMILSGANTYTGKTTVSAGTLQLGAVNTIATSTGLTLSGGTLSPGGFSESISGALTLSSASTIDVGLGGTLSFADSHTATWSGDLDLLNWTSADNDDTLQFGVSAGGLTAAQLGDIEFDDSSSTLGDAAIDAEGFVYETPEPSTIALGLLGGLGILLMRRKKA